MDKVKKFVFIFSIVLLLTSFNCVRPVFAGIPSITNVVVRESDGHTILDVTFAHVPSTPPSHYVNRIVININGINQTFNIVQNTTSFTHSCDLGIVEGTPDALIWAHCVVDGNNLTPYGPIQTPEFSLLALLLTLILGTILATFASRKIRLQRPSFSSEAAHF